MFIDDALKKFRKENFIVTENQNIIILNKNEAKYVLERRN